MGQPKVLAGPNTLCFVNGVLLGSVAGFDWNSSEATKQIRGLDSLRPFELAPASVSAGFRMTIWRLIGDGGAEGQGMTTNFPRLPQQKYFTLTIIERRTDTIVYRSNFCKVVDQNWGIHAKALVQGVIACEVLDWDNEAAG